MDSLKEPKPKDPISRVFFGDRAIWSKERKLEYARKCWAEAVGHNWLHCAAAWRETCVALEAES